MSNYAKTRLRKRKPDEANETKTFENVSKMSKKSVCESGCKLSEDPQAINDTRQEDEIYSADLEDTKEYESEIEEKTENSNGKEETFEVACKQKRRTDFRGLFSKSGNCELLSKLLNDSCDTTIEQNSDQGGTKNPCNDQESTENSSLILGKDASTESPMSEDHSSDKQNKGKSDVQKEQLQRSDYQEEVLMSCQESCSVIKGPLSSHSNSPRINAVKRDNPHLTELIMNNDTKTTTSEDVSETTGTSPPLCNNTLGKQVLNNKADLSDKDLRLEFRQNKSEVENKSTKALRKSRRGSKKLSNFEGVEAGCATWEENATNNTSRKTSIRLRHRSGDSWAVRYEKDFVVTPLAKISKEEATYLPSKGIDATIVSEERLCRELRQSCERAAIVDNYENITATEPSTSTGKCHRGRKKKYKYLTKKGVESHHAERVFTSSFTNQGDETACLPSEAVHFSPTASETGRRSETRRGTRSTTQLENSLDLFTRRPTNDEELLTDSRLSRHACALWSSENRRHFQMTHQESSGEVLDNLMRSAWEGLGNKEKLKYVLRARNALRDRNKHSRNPSTSSKNTGQLTQEENEGDRFFYLPADEQHQILKKKLDYFQRILSHGEYMRLIQDFKIVFRSKVESMHVCRATYKSQGIKHLEDMSRSMLYQKIKSYEPRVEERRNQLFSQLRKEQDRRFQNLVMDILNDESVWRSEHDEMVVVNEPDDEKADEVQDELGWILENLKNSDNEGNKTDWSQDDKEQIRRIAEQLQQEPEHFREAVEMELCTAILPVVENESFCDVLLRDARLVKTLPVLCTADIENIIGKQNATLATLSTNGTTRKTFAGTQAPPPQSTFHDYVLNPGSAGHEEGPESSGCCEPDSPSCMLTTALVSDCLERRQPPMDYLNKIIRPTCTKP